MIETVSILIASLGRPSLRETLRSIAAATVPPGIAIEVVIADDSGSDAVAACLAGFDTPLTIRIVPAGARNVSIARNKSVEAARGDWLLLIDDDEYVAPDWLAAHLATARACKADVVFGPVHPVYPDSTPAWITAANPMFHDMGWSDHGRRVDYGQSGNTLIRAVRVKSLGIAFDPAFGRTGGEDNDYFRRLAALGAVMVVTDRARAFETVPAERVAPSYLLDRMTRTGRIYATTALRDAGGLRRIAFAADAAVKLMVAAIAALLLAPVDPAKAFRMQMKQRSNLGKLTGLIGHKPTAAWS